MIQISIAEARNRFTSLVRRVEKELAVELTRRGKPVAVILSVEEYQRLMAQENGFWDAYQSYQEKIDLLALDIEPDELFERDQTDGREVNL